MDKGIYFRINKVGYVDNNPVVAGFSLVDRHTNLFTGYRGPNKAQRQGVRNIIWRWLNKSRKGVYLAINYPEVQNSDTEWPIVGNYADPYNVLFSDDAYERSEAITYDTDEKGRTIIIPRKFVESIWSRRQEQFTWRNRENIFCSIRKETKQTVEGPLEVIKKYSKGIVVRGKIKYFPCNIFDQDTNLSDFAVPSSRMQNTSPIWGFLATRPIPSSDWGNYINSVSFKYELIVEGDIEGEDGKIYTVRSEPIKYKYNLPFNYYSVKKNKKEKIFRGNAEDVWRIFLKDSVIPSVRQIWEDVMEEKKTNKPARKNELVGFSIFHQETVGFSVLYKRKDIGPTGSEVRSISPLPVQWKPEEVNYQKRELSIYFYSCKVKINYIPGKKGEI